MSDDDFDRTGLVYRCVMRFSVKPEDFRMTYHEDEETGARWSHAKGYPCKTCAEVDEEGAAVESVSEHAERTDHREYMRGVASTTSECSTCHATVLPD